jgi:hypothetical protein
MIRNVQVYLIHKAVVARAQSPTAVVGIANSSANVLGHIPIPFSHPNGAIYGGYSKQTSTLPSRFWIRPFHLPSIVGAISFSGPELPPLLGVDHTLASGLTARCW